MELESDEEPEPDSEPKSAVEPEPVVKAVGLAKRFGSFIALHPLDVTVHSGEFFGVFGPNGAGKSTFIRLLTGQIPPSRGGASVLGIDPVSDSRLLKANIGIVPESESPPSFLTAHEFLTMVARLRDLPEIDEIVGHWLDFFGITDRAKTLCKDLSKGQRQKLMLSAALMHQPRLLFLDEPFVNLDPLYQRKSRELLVDYVAAGGTIFLCSHILEIAERLCTRFAVIDEGRVLAHGTFEEIRNTGEWTLEDVFIRLVSESGKDVQEGDE